MEAAWTPRRDPAAWAYLPVIAPKWIAADGKSFWLVWSDLKHASPWRESLDVEIFNAATEEEYERLAAEYLQAHPCHGFNTQRIDLVLE